jgi:hypothetical protein
VVEQDDLPRAREILAEADGGFDEEELARLSEEAGQRSTPDDQPTASSTADVPGGPVQAVGESPKHHRLRHALGRFAGHRTDMPRDPFGR